MNKYSKGLLTTMVLLIMVGGMLVYLGGRSSSSVISWVVTIFGFALFVFGGLMVQGFSWPTDAETSKVWLIRYFGQLTDQKATGVTLLLDWLPFEVVGKVEIDLKKVDHDFKLFKPVLCCDDIYIDNEQSKVSVTLQPDDTSGETLRNFLNAGGTKGIIEQIDDMLTFHLQEIAMEPNHTSHWMETSGEEIRDALLEKINGLKVANGKIIQDNNPADDARNLGIRFPKFVVSLLPAKEVIAARNDVQVKKERQRALLVGTAMIEEQIKARQKLYAHLPEAQRPTMTEIRNMIIQENLTQDGKVSQVINKDGLNLVGI